MLRPLESLPWALPGDYVTGALLAAAIPARGWPALTTSTRVALGVAASYCAAAAISGYGSPSGARAAAILAVLVAFLGWVIGDYSCRYLRGEPGQFRFRISLLSTLAAVSAVAASTNLGVMIVAWAASSAGLHHLLTFYRDRPAALIVAHKKFLASRLAEGLLVVAAILLYREWGTLDIAAITSHAQVGIPLPRAATVAAVLISAAVLLKCAQLPLHGWLIQVMEAPTPVSALLHAGVVNLGGYVLIRLAPLIAASPEAQTLLVLVGSLTAAIAGLVMLTRVTIKVRLAWSTCSQMGFMVMECGMGLYDLALLHLIAHALYKAHAFLTAGDTVRDVLARRLVAQTVGGTTGRPLAGPLLALPVAWLCTSVSAALWHRAVGLPLVPWVAMTLLAVGLATLLWTPARGLRPNWRGLLSLVAGAQVYLGWHWVMSGWIGVVAFPPNPGLAIWSVLVFVALYLAQVVVSVSQQSSWAAGPHRWIYAGLYLDEHFTRLTFRVWPVRPPRGVPDSPTIHDPTPTGSTV